MGIVDEALGGSIVDEALAPKTKKPGLLDRISTFAGENFAEGVPGIEMGGGNEAGLPAVAATAAGLPLYPVSGIAGIMTAAAGGSNKEVGEAVRKVQSVPSELLLSNEAEQKTAEALALPMKPIEMAGEGLKEIVRQTPLEGTIAEPIAGTIGEAFAMFGLPGAFKRGKKAPVEKTEPGRIKKVDVIDQEVRPRSIVDEALKVEPEAKVSIVDEALGAEERKSIIVQRVEEPGIKASFDKPQGLYTSPESVESPHLDLGGEITKYEISPDAIILDIKPFSGEEIAIRKGAINAGAGVHAAREILGKKEFSQLKSMSKEEAIKWASERFPETDFTQYYDKQEVIEAVGGLEARKKGYDAFRVPDLTDPAFDEFVILNKNIAKEVKKSPDLSQLAAETRKTEQAGKISFRKTEAKEPAVKFDGEIEQRFKAAQGQRPEPVFARFNSFMTGLGHKMSRPFEHLPKTREYAEVQFALKRLEKQGDVTKERAIREKAAELQGLDRADYDLFTRKVILDDLLTEAEKGRDLPFGFTPETLRDAAGKVESYVSQSPKVQEALLKRKASWDNLKTEYTQAMQDIGFDVADRFTNENYFRHQVLEYANAKGIYGTGQKLKTPANRGFLKKREGSTKDINTDYLEAEFEVYGQMLRDIETARVIKRIDQIYNIADRVRKDAKAKGIEDWKRAIPEGYTTWQPREGNVFYFSDSIPAKLAEQLYSGALEEIGLTKEQLNKVMAVGGKRREFVIKQELADTLNELVKNKSQAFFPEFWRTTQKAWKVWQLISPRRLIKYNIRNLTGDADAAFVGNPSGFSRVPQAAKELYSVYVEKKPMSPEMQAYFDRGGLSATLQAQEIGDLKKLWVFKKLYPGETTPASLPRKAWEKYWKAARMSTDFREGILRYANYLDYLEQMKKSPEGLPKNFGASIPEEIKGLSDIRDRAFWLSNDLLGAYDRVSVFGQTMREHVFPFWSWKEVNFKRYKQFVKNSIDEGTAPSALAKKVLGSMAIKSPYIAYRVGSFLVKAATFSSMLTAWNHLMFPEEEKALSQDIKKSTHIILGRDPKSGEIIYFNRMGALGDLLEWFGLDAAPKTVDKWLSGKQSLQDTALEMAKDTGKAPLNVFASGSFPFAKLGLETATRRSTFPDITRPSTIRDRGLYLARSFGLDNEYRALAGLPSQGYGKSAAKAFIYSSDPLEGSYRDIFELKSEFSKKMGKGAEGFWLTPKGDALYNFRLALRYGDKVAADKYASDYFNLGGTAQGMKSSIKSMEPLSGLNKYERNAFIALLTPEEQKKYDKAERFYSTVLLGK